MASSDWPDYTHGVVLSSGGPVTDCPDWQEQVVAPGGGPVGGGVGYLYEYLATTFTLTGGVNTTVLTLTVPAVGVYLACGVLTLATSGAAQVIGGIRAGTATLSRAGAQSTVQIPANNYGFITMAPILVVTVAGTIVLQAASSNSGTQPLAPAGAVYGGDQCYLSLVGPLST